MPDQEDRREYIRRRQIETGRRTRISEDEVKEALALITELARTGTLCIDGRQRDLLNEFAAEMAGDGGFTVK